MKHMVWVLLVGSVLTSGAVAKASDLHVSLAMHATGESLGNPCQGHLRGWRLEGDACVYRADLQILPRQGWQQVMEPLTLSWNAQKGCVEIRFQTASAEIVNRVTFPSFDGRLLPLNGPHRFELEGAGTEFGSWQVHGEFIFTTVE